MAQKKDLITKQKGRSRFTIDAAHENLNLYEQQIVQDIWKDKYRYGEEKHPFESMRRVVEGVYKNDPDIDARRDALEAMQKALWIPAGRIHAGAGTSKVVTLMNCLSGDTKFYTREYGVVDLKFCVDREVTVLTEHGWELAEIKCFGKQKLQRITFKAHPQALISRTVDATVDHKWPTMSGEVTTALRVGHIVPSMGLTPMQVCEDNEEYNAGWRHGFVFGDGTLNRTTQRKVAAGYRIGTKHFVLRLCGKKREHLERFKGYHVGYPPATKGDPVVYIHTAENLKDVPDHNNSFSYIRGFIEGWYAADGHKSDQRQMAIGGSNKNAFDWLMEYAPLGGYICYGRAVTRKASTQTNLGTLRNDLEIVKIKSVADAVWHVVNIEPLGEDDVYCAVVPSTHMFTLAGGIYTGNCYVDRTIEDSMSGIADALKDAMLTMQQGGGIGMDFSTLRPRGAYLHRTGAPASGPLPFMDMWDSMCATIKSAGDRRGAMMGVMHCEHPDLIDFIAAKRVKGRLTNFNVSVLVSDAFMDAVANDEDWYLGFGVPRMDGKHLFETIRDDKHHVGPWYAYSVYKARDIWEKILRNTYDWSEPGVIFIDRINFENNLHYTEVISCTNPCGEQPLPPNACCNLGAVNLARMVKKPFTSQASFDYALLEKITAVGVRFLDNVMEVTYYPLAAQMQEEMKTRRIGAGITGLADALAQLGLLYGSPESLAVIEKIERRMAIAAYTASHKLGLERGAFPAWNAKYWGINNPVVQKLPKLLKAAIYRDGLRNGVLLTIAPTGTTSIYAGNVSSGLEPVFLHSANRKVLQADESFKTYTVYGYGALLYRSLHPDTELPAYMNTHEDLTPMQHLQVQEVCQRWVDASISKTINCPEAIKFEEFSDIYTKAYSMGLKGCTTYRPSDVRGSVLSKVDTAITEVSKTIDKDIIKYPVRPESLEGRTYKIKWPNDSESYYVTINDLDGQPYEIFIQSTSAKHSDWITALSLMLSAIMRRGDDISFVPNELRKVVSVNDVGWVAGKFYGSLVAMIGDTIGKHLNRNDIQAFESSAIKGSKITGESTQLTKAPVVATSTYHEICSACNMPTLTRMEGCKKCISCGYSSC